MKTVLLFGLVSAILCEPLRLLLGDPGAPCFERSQPRFNAFLAETDLAANPNGRQDLLASEFVHSGLGYLQGLCYFVCLEQPHVLIPPVRRERPSS